MWLRDSWSGKDKTPVYTGTLRLGSVGRAPGQAIPLLPEAAWRPLGTFFISPECRGCGEHFMAPLRRPRHRLTCLEMLNPLPWVEGNGVAHWPPGVTTHFCPPGRSPGSKGWLRPEEAAVSSVLSLQACLPPRLS